MKTATAILVLVAISLVCAAVSPWFVWLDWDANPPDDAVEYYTIYLGEEPNPQTRLDLGNQTSVQLLLNHPHTYVALTATNAVGESPRSEELHIVKP